MLDNKLGSLNKDIVATPKKCRQCDDTLNDKNRVRRSGYIGYESICRLCRNKNNLKYSRKKAQIIKDNPLW